MQQQDDQETAGVCSLLCPGNNEKANQHVTGWGLVGWWGGGSEKGGWLPRKVGRTGDSAIRSRAGTRRRLAMHMAWHTNLCTHEPRNEPRCFAEQNRPESRQEHGFGKPKLCLLWAGTQPSTDVWPPSNLGGPMWFFFQGPSVLNDLVCGIHRCLASLWQSQKSSV